MAGTPLTSDVSGELINADAPAEVVYVFADGRRRAVTMTTREAAVLRDKGTDRTTRLSRLVAWSSWRLLVKWILTAIAGALIAGLIAGYISDRYSDKQREVELEGNLVTQVSQASVDLYQKAQTARATPGIHQRKQRDKAADAWVLASGGITPVLDVYYPGGSAVVRNWDAYQAAMYDWAVLGCCTTSEGRPALVKTIRDYVTTRVGPSNRPPPVPDPWGTLAAVASPDHDLYQWVGNYLLRGRGALLEDLRHASPALD